MPINEGHFGVWVEKDGFVPTARLHSWPTWYHTRNLRFFGSVSWVAATPHDIETRVRLEALHESIVKHVFFDPLVYENGISENSNRRDVYVSLIPGPVVDWFSKHTLEEIHEQIAIYVALLEIEEKYDNPNIIGDTHSSYHLTINQQLNNFWKKYPQLEKTNHSLGPHDLFERENPEVKDYNAFFQRKTEIEKIWRQYHPADAQMYDEKRDKYEDAKSCLLNEIYESGKLPNWFLRECVWEDSRGQSHKYLKLQKLRHDENFGWRRPTGALADDFGIVSYGITYGDALRLRGEKIEYDKETKKEIVKELTSKEFEDAQKDSLCRTEADATAFEFLMYAQSKKKEWPSWSISPVNNTGYIYLYSDGHATKIGYSSTHPDREKRKNSLQTGNSRPLELLGTIDGTLKKEAILKKRYAHKRTIGEWFELSKDDIESILSGK